MKIFVVVEADRVITRIRAETFQLHGQQSQYTIFEIGENIVARFANINIVSIAQQDVLVTDYAEGSIFPDVTDIHSGETDFLYETMFDESEHRPFDTEERKALKAALTTTAQEIQTKFDPGAQATEDINQKLDYLSRKVDQLSAFDWKRLLVTTIVGVAVDLGYGTKIPSALIEIFKEVITHFVKKITKRK